ncbi:DUF4328 domain-containing protein [bacterium]|nr:DUF4328 domain-containing protein [bacterium]
MDNETRKAVSFESGHSRAKWVSIFLVLIVVLDLVAIVSDYMEIQLINRALRGETVTMVEATANDSRQAAIGGIYLVLFVITAILFCMWIHRAHRNLPSLGASDLKYSPGWAVGYFFIPILSIFRPFQVTTEIWKASDPTTEINESLAWKSAPTSPLIASWWVLFLVSAFLGNILFRVSLQAETLGELLTAGWLTFVLDVLDIPAAILAIFLIRNIDLRQQQKHQCLTSYVTV